jgi:hypothetical protein
MNIINNFYDLKDFTWKRNTSMIKYDDSDDLET